MCRSSNPKSSWMDDHSLQRCFEVTENVLRVVFFQLHSQGVVLEGIVLKPNMVVPGLTCPKQEGVNEVADATVSCLLRAVPAAVPAIAFLVGRSIGRVGFCTFERDEYSFQIAVTLGGGIFVCPRYPAAGFGAVEGPGCECAGSAAGFISPRMLQPGCSPRRILGRDGEEMTGSKHNREGNSSDKGEPDPGPYWRRMHRDWRFWFGALSYGSGARHLRAKRRPGLGATRAPASVI